MKRYLIPAGTGEAEYIEKRSRFIGHVWHVKSEEEAVSRIQEMREKYWDANHNVYAYGIKESGAMRYSDDGEPGGTSGQPTMNVFLKNELTDFCCVVTRYFGGTLLGAGGLVRAYSKTAVMALEEAGIAEMKTLSRLVVLCSYPQFERIKFELKNFDAVILDTEYGADVTLTVTVPQENTESFRLRVIELTAATAMVEPDGEVLVPVKIEK